MIDTSKFTCIGEAWNKVILLPVNSSVLTSDLIADYSNKLGGPALNRLKLVGRSVPKKA